MEVTLKQKTDNQQQVVVGLTHFILDFTGLDDSENTKGIILNALYTFYRNFFKIFNSVSADFRFIVLDS